MDLDDYIPARPVVTCGPESRVHYGPVLINGDLGGGKQGPVCYWCKSAITREQRDQINRTWETMRRFWPHGKDYRA